MKILIVEDDAVMIRSLYRQLKNVANHIVCAQDYHQALSYVFQKDIDVIICDYYLSSNKDSKQGLDLIKKMRAEGVTTPVLMLTGKSSEHVSPWNALDNGVDDFMKKPYYTEELIARLYSIYRRKFPIKKNSSNVLEYKNIRLNLHTRAVEVGTNKIIIGNMLFLIFKKFLKSPNTLLSHEFLIEYLWGESALYQSQSSNVLRVHINHLKSALGEQYGKNIKAVYGAGYIWED